MKKIRVCAGPHCNYRKSNRIMDALRKYFDKENSVDLDYCACTGFCEEGPNVVVDDQWHYKKTDPKTIAENIINGKGKELKNLANNSAQLKIEDLFEKI